jgi:hypothetical protein
MNQPMIASARLTQTTNSFALQYAELDAKRTYLTADELYSLVWHFRFKESSGEELCFVLGGGATLFPTCACLTTTSSLACFQALG